MTVDFHGRGDVGEDVAFDASGRIVAAGGTTSSTEAEFALARVKPEILSGTVVRRAASRRMS